MNINQLRIVTLVVALFLCIQARAQEAEKLFKEQYSKISFIFQPSILQNSSEAKNNDGSSYPSMDFTNDFSYQFGFYYNFLQTGNFNFKTGIIAKEFIPKFDLNISDDDLATGHENLLIDFAPYNQFILSVPVKAEYFQSLNDKFNFNFGLGLSIDFFTGVRTDVLTYAIVEDINGNSRSIFSALSKKQKNVNIGSELSIGINYKAKFALIDLSLFASRKLGANYTEGDYIIYDLAETEDKTGTFNIKNNFYGLSLSVTPKKGWLKKNSSKTTNP